MSNEGAAVAGWRDDILREFTPGVARLTISADPDGLLLEAALADLSGCAGVRRGHGARDGSGLRAGVPGPARIPFDDSDVRIYVDNLFLEGALRPIAHPRGQEVAESWARAGIAIDPRADRARRLDRLLASVETSMPNDAAFVASGLIIVATSSLVATVVMKNAANPPTANTRKTAKPPMVLTFGCNFTKPLHQG